MIAKCIAVLAIIGQINASICGCGPSSVVLPSSESYSHPAVLATSGRNVVAQGKYPVALSNCGPMPSQQIPVTTSAVTAPVQEKPIIRLPASIPAPRTICHSCTCYKTIVKPRVHQQIITVPTVQRYVETLHKPVVEKVQYEALPVNCGGVVSSSGMISVGAGSVCGSPVQAIQVPSCGVSVAQPIEVSYAQPVQIPSCGVSVAQPIGVSCAQPVQVPVVQSVSSPCVQPIVESIPAPCLQRIEVPQTISLGCSSQCSC